MYIEKLHALQELKVCHNLLQCLPTSIEKLANLKILDVSHNCLLYLPINIFYLQLFVDISKNPFLSINFHHVKIKYSAVSTLVELSANIVLRHRFVATIVVVVVLFTCCFYLHVIFINRERRFNELKAFKDHKTMFANYIVLL